MIINAQRWGGGLNNTGTVDGVITCEMGIQMALSQLSIKRTVVAVSTIAIIIVFCYKKKYRFKGKPHPKKAVARACVATKLPMSL